MVDSRSQCAEENLLGVGDQQRLGLGPEAGHGAARKGRLDAIVETGELQGHHPAARLAGDADARGIDLGPKLEVVQSAYCVPGAVLHQVVADQVALVAQHAVLGGPGAERGSASLLVEELQTLALPQGIPGENCDSVAGHEPGEPLIALRRLACCGVPTGEDHRGHRTVAILRTVQVGRDVKRRPAFEDDPLDPVVIALDPAELSGIQRRAGRKRSPHAFELRPDALAQRVELLDRFERGELGSPVLVQQAEVLDVVLPQHRGKA